MPYVDDKTLTRWKAHVEFSTGCWTWTGPVRPDGYGQLYVEGRLLRPHRLAYEHFIGPIPEGLTLDHSCHTTDLACLGARNCTHRRCVNPAHLAVVTTGQNVSLAHARAPKTHCPQGHPYDEANTGRRKSGARYCRKCASVQSYASAKRRKERDPEYAQAERERGHEWYMRLRDGILARRRAQRATAESRAKRRAASSARRTTTDSDGLSAEMAARHLGIGRHQVAKLASDDPLAPPDRLHGHRGIVNGRHGWVFEPTEVERFGQLPRPIGQRRKKTS
jgi:hypothetical protein